MENNLIIILSVCAFFIVVILGWLAYLTLYITRFVKRKKEVIDKVKQAGVENLLRENLQAIEKNKIDIKELYQIVDNLGKLSAMSITRIGFVRFNPFGDTGGDQSFSIALINAQNNGVVISSLHGRQETRVYSKPVVGGESEYTLTKEEKEAINRAQGEKH